MARALRNPVGEWRIVCGGTSRATTYRPVIFSHIWQRNAGMPEDGANRLANAS
jgi:hypothetical protein